MTYPETNTPATRSAAAARLRAGARALGLWRDEREEARERTAKALGDYTKGKRK